MMAALRAWKTTIGQLAKQANRLATALQNALPHQETKQTTPAIQYLFEIAQYLVDCEGKASALLTQDVAQHSDDLKQLVQETVDKDNALREQHQIAQKFQFIHDQLAQAATACLQTLSAVPIKKQKIRAEEQPTQDEKIVYVYLFNAHGLQLETWFKMLSPAVFYDHSINRPIYQDKAQIDSFIGRKPNPMQHGYLTVVVKSQDILPVSPDAPLKDMYGYPLLKVKEGALHFDKCIAFTHNAHEYQVTEAGALALNK
jgi:hypothetical protein